MRTMSRNIEFAVAEIGILKSWQTLLHRKVLFNKMSFLSSRVNLLLQNLPVNRRIHCIILAIR